MKSWDDAALVNCLLGRQESLSTPIKPDMVAYAYNLSTGEAVIGGSIKLAGQLA